MNTHFKAQNVSFQINVVLKVKDSHIKKIMVLEPSVDSISGHLVVFI